MREAKKEVRQWRYTNGYRGKVAPDVVGETLKALEDERGAVRPGDVVEAARPDEAPLHPEFEWNDSEAAERWRRHQARDLIRAVEVVSVDSETEETTPTDRFVSVERTRIESNGETRGGYRSVSVIKNEPAAYAAALAMLTSTMAASARAVEELKAMAERDPASDSTMLARIGIAAQALRTAQEAVSALH